MGYKKRWRCLHPRNSSSGSLRTDMRYRKAPNQNEIQRICLPLEPVIFSNTEWWFGSNFPATSLSFCTKMEEIVRHLVNLVEFLGSRKFSEEPRMLNTSLKLFLVVTQQLGLQFELYIQFRFHNSRWGFTDRRKHQVQIKTFNNWANNLHASGEYQHVYLSEQRNQRIQVWLDRHW